MGRRPAHARRAHPCLINKIGQPEPLGNDARGQQVLAYIEHITEQGRLNARYTWDGDQVVIALA